MVEMDARAVDAVRKRIEQIGAVESAKRCAEARCSSGLVAIVKLGASVHVAGQDAGSDIRNRRDLIAQPDRAQRPDRLWTDIDARADLAEARRALKDICFDAEMRQRGRGRQSGETTPDDSDA